MKNIHTQEICERYAFVQFFTQPFPSLDIKEHGC